MKGDSVIVTTGRLKGQKGRVLKTHPRQNQVTVENLNIVKKHQKPNQEHPQGAIVEVNKPIAVCKVALLEPKSGRPTKVAYQMSKDGDKVRLYKRSGQPVSAGSRQAAPAQEKSQTKAKKGAKK